MRSLHRLRLCIKFFALTLLIRPSQMCYTVDFLALSIQVTFVNNISLQGNPPVRLLAAFQTAYPSLVPNQIVKAADREMWVAAVNAPLGHFTVHVADLDARTTFSYQSAKSKRTVTSRPLPSWARYVAGVILMSDDNQAEVSGLTAVIAGNEPPGPRYEYALGIAFATLWYELHSTPYTITNLMELMDRIRREYVEQGH